MKRGIACSLASVIFGLLILPLETAPGRLLSLLKRGLDKASLFKGHVQNRFLERQATIIQPAANNPCPIIVSSGSWGGGGAFGQLVGVNVGVGGQSEYRPPWSTGFNGMFGVPFYGGYIGGQGPPSVVKLDDCDKFPPQADTIVRNDQGTVVIPASNTEKTRGVSDNSNNSEALEANNSQQPQTSPSYTLENEDILTSMTHRPKAENQEYDLANSPLESGESDKLPGNRFVIDTYTRRPGQGQPFAVYSSIQR